MAKTPKLNLREMTDADLKSKLADEKSRMTRLRFNHAVTPLENPMVIRQVRRDIARMTHEMANRIKKNANN